MRLSELIEENPTAPKAVKDLYQEELELDIGMDEQIWRKYVASLREKILPKAYPVHITDLSKACDETFEIKSEEDLIELAIAYSRFMRDLTSLQETFGGWQNEVAVVRNKLVSFAQELGVPVREKSKG